MDSRDRKMRAGEKGTGSEIVDSALMQGSAGLCKKGVDLR